MWGENIIFWRTKMNAIIINKISGAKNYFLTILLLITLTLFGGCSGGSGSARATVNPYDPQEVTITVNGQPLNSLTNVSTLLLISMYFKHQVDPASINSNTIVLNQLIGASSKVKTKATINVPLVFTLSTDGHTVTVVPAITLDGNVGYSLIIYPTVVAEDGSQIIAKPMVTSFTTGSFPKPSSEHSHTSGW